MTMRTMIALLLAAAAAAGAPAPGPSAGPDPAIPAGTAAPVTADSAEPRAPMPAGEIVIPGAAPAAPAPAGATAPAPARDGGRKSIKTAFFLSLALPGAGEYYVGAKRYTASFLTAEGLIWSFALVSKYQGEMWRRDYRDYAAVQAGANYSREDDDYYRDIYEYPNSEWYNEDQWRQARDLYPDDLPAQAAYVSDKLYGVADAWRWQTDGEWSRYRELRVRSRNALQRISYAAGSALLNHLLSAVNAARLARRYNKQRTVRAGAAWRLDVARHPDGAFRVLVAGEF